MNERACRIFITEHTIDNHTVILSTGMLWSRVQRLICLSGGASRATHRWGGNGWLCWRTIVSFQIAVPGVLFSLLLLSFHLLPARWIKVTVRASPCVYAGWELASVAMEGMSSIWGLSIVQAF